MGTRWLHLLCFRQGENLGMDTFFRKKGEPLPSSANAAIFLAVNDIMFLMTSAYRGV